MLARKATMRGTRFASLLVTLFMKAAETSACCPPMPMPTPTPPPMPIDCRWGPWAFLPCSASCGGGQEIGRRTIAQQLMHGGAPCAGQDILVMTCNSCPCDAGTSPTTTPNTGMIRVRNSNLGLCFFAFKCCVSQLSEDQMSSNLVNF